MTNRQFHRLKKQWLAEGYRMGKRRAQLNEGFLNRVAGGLIGNMLAGPIGAVAGFLGGNIIADGISTLYKKIAGILTPGQKVLANNVNAIAIKKGEELSKSITSASNKKMASKQAFAGVLIKALSGCNQEAMADIKENGIGKVAGLINGAFEGVEGYESPSSSEVKSIVDAYMQNPAAMQEG